MNIATAPQSTKQTPQISPEGDELGWIEFRTQTDAERQWRDAITPRQGFKLKFTDVDDLRFRIEVVAESDTDAKAENLPQGLAREDLEVLAAQNGVVVRPGDRASDIQHRLKATRKTA